MKGILMSGEQCPYRKAPKLARMMLESAGFDIRCSVNTGLGIADAHTVSAPL